VRLHSVALGLAGFYGTVADEISRPGPGKLALISPPPVMGPAVPRRQAGDDAGTRDGLSPADQLPHPHLLWVQEHLHHLSSSAQTVAEPALHVAQIRRRPWWR
jgi:hypothetical protein